jgi:pyridoxal phosphate enzyme (YggS family)
LTLASRREETERRILEACLRSGRQREDVHMIAVTKYVSTLMTLEVLRSGLHHLGENRWQNAADKWYAVESASHGDNALGQVVWHFIGSLQTNKVKDVVGRFAYIHSLDRLSLAKAISKQAVELGIETSCFIQVNVSGEASKHGVSPEGLAGLAQDASALPNIRIAGLMTMAPFEGEPEETRPVFRGLRNLRDELNRKALLPYEVKDLSMGMSNDFEVAVEEGATWLRLGTILVGKEEE